MNFSCSRCKKISKCFASSPIRGAPYWLDIMGRRNKRRKTSQVPLRERERYRTRRRQKNRWERWKHSKNIRLLIDCLINLALCTHIKNIPLNIFPSSFGKIYELWNEGMRLRSCCRKFSRIKSFNLIFWEFWCVKVAWEQTEMIIMITNKEVNKLITIQGCKLKSCFWKLLSEFIFSLSKSLSSGNLSTTSFVNSLKALEECVA